MSDPLDDFLEHPPAAPVDTARKEALFQRTAALLPRRWQRWPMLAAAACLAIALGATWYVFRGATVEPAPKDDLVERKRIPAPAPPKPESPPPVKTTYPPDIEWAAFDAADDSQRVKLYFQAGDLYLAAHDDIASAVRCYQQALHYADARALEFNPDDNWLVMALKRDRRKEP